MSHLFKASLLLTVFFGVNKIIALIRQALIAKEFGFTAEIDAFNISNNLPDLVFSLFSGGALAIAFIPVFSEYITEYGKVASWKLFSKTANLIFLVTAFLSILFAIFADPIISWEFGIAPGFSQGQQNLVASLMRLQLVATLIFSISGLVMASLQANKHFLLPAISPILYNVGQIIGITILAPSSPFIIFGIALPSMGLGVYGLVYGVLLGSFMHLGIQFPGLLKFGFVWNPSINLLDSGVKKVFALMIPRIATVFLIQLIFLSRDNLASRLSEGAVTALTYGYFIFQVPETLIGTAIATALLPTLSQFATKNQYKKFETILNSSIRVIVAATLVTTILLSLSLSYLIDIFFDFSSMHKDTLVWTSRAFLLGLLAQSLLEIIVRAFYARQDAISPLVATAFRTAAFLILGVLSYRIFGPVGLSMSDTLATTLEVVILLLLLSRYIPKLMVMQDTLLRSVLGSLTSAVTFLFIIQIYQISDLPRIVLALTASTCAFILFVRKELKLLLRL